MAKHDQVRRHDSGPARVSVTGTGRVERAADIAHVTFVVEASRPTAAEARGVADVDRRTAGLDVSPTWEHDGTRSIRTGFTVTNRIAAVVRDLERVGAVLDAGLEAGATGLDGVRFDLADAAADTTEARRLAVLDARSRARTIAKAASGRLGALVAVAEAGAPVPLPRREARMMAMAGDSSPTPVIPGSVEVTVSVTAEWELDPG
jgi:uncharacterized protein